MGEQPELIAGRYRLMNRIGSGGMGHVWLAWDERLSRAVAIKQLHSPVGLPEAEARIAHERAMREARITARLHHPNAVPVFDVVDHDGRPCLVMQYLPSRSLHAVLAARGPLPAREVAQLGSELASALAAAHRADIVHRDVKPGNVLVAEDGTVRITDFGISHALGDPSLTSTGMVTGTPAYLAPEVARGTSASPASDVFSLGATLYAAAEGAPPFGTGDNAMALLHRVASGAITPPAEGPLSPVLLAMLAAAPEDRPSMQDVSVELATIAAGRAPRTVAMPRSAASDVGSAVRPARTRPLPAVAAPSEPAPSEPAPSEPAPTVVSGQRETAGAAGAGGQAGRGRERTAYAGADAPTPPAASLQDDEPTRPKRRRVPLLLLAALVLSGAGLLVWALQGADPATGGQPRPPVAGSTAPGTTPQPATSATSTPSTTTAQDPSPSSSAPSRPTSSPTPSGTQASTSAPASTRRTTPSSAAPAGTTDADLARAVQDYYAVLPGDTDAGWARLTDRYRATTSGTRATYGRFWGSVDRVEVRQAAGQAPGSAVATLRYTFDDGRRFEERTSYSLVDEGGTLKIDRSSVLSSRQL